MSDASRRRVSYNQLATLCDFLTTHKEIATGYNKSARARDTSRRMWQTIADSLNSDGDGAVKDWKGWSKYWNDYKSKLKKTVSSINASLRRTGGGPGSDVRTLTEVESRFLQILGDSFGSGLPGARVEPFSQEIEIHEDGGALDSTFTLGNTQTSPQPGPSRLSGAPSAPAQSQPQPPFTFTVTAPHLSPTAPHMSPTAPHMSPTAPHMSSTAPHTPEARPPPLPSTPSSLRRSPRRRLQVQRQQQQQPQRRTQRRREPPMSQEVARRNLIAISEQRSRHDEVRNNILQELVLEIKKIKEILLARLPEPELPETPVLNPPPH